MDAAAPPALLDAAESAAPPTAALPAASLLDLLGSPLAAAAAAEVVARAFWYASCHSSWICPPPVVLVLDVSPFDNVFLPMTFSKKCTVHHAQFSSSLSFDVVSAAVVSPSQGVE